jgi:HK97 family phage major capsid protein
MFEALKTELREILARMKAFRDAKPEDVTDEKRAQNKADLARAKEVKAQIDEIEEAMALDASIAARGDDGYKPPANGDTNIEVPDQPIYRGSAASVLGQQALDVRAMQDPSVGGADREAAADRLERSHKRTLHLIEKRQGQVSKDFEARGARQIAEARAAGTGMVQDGQPSDGGFLLQGETSIDLITHGFNNSEVLPRCAKRTLSPGTDSIKIVGINETSRADGSRGGGIRVYSDAELSQITSSKTEFDWVKIEPEKLTGLFYASDKVLRNVTFLGQEMKGLFGEEFSFKTQDHVINGLGAGMALGILNADCLISVSAESGQEGDTILAENVLKMYARFWPSGASNSLVWLANRNTFFQLYTMTYDIGTGGEMARLYVPPQTPGGTGSMLGYPVIFIEQAAGLGDAGDLMLCDMSQYICADYGTVEEASSIHLKFDYTQTTFRFVYYFDGQPRWRSALTPYKGSSDTVGPFVAIAART